MSVDAVVADPHQYAATIDHPTTRFRPGAATAFVSPDIVALACCPSDAIADLLWELVDDRREIDTIRPRVAGERTALAVARFDGSDVRLALVGDLTARVVTSTTSEIRGARQWSESRHTQVREVSLIAGPGSVDDLVIVAGVVPASSVTRVVMPTADTADDDPDLRAGPRVADARDEQGAPLGRTTMGYVERATGVAGADRVAPDAAPPASACVLVFSTGERVLLDADQRLCIGRGRATQGDPSGSRWSARRVRLAAPHVSRRHAEVVTDARSMSVSDLGSAHGTRLVDGPVQIDLTPGEPIPLHVGCEVVLAGVVSFRVEQTA